MHLKLGPKAWANRPLRDAASRVCQAFRHIDDDPDLTRSVAFDFDYNPHWAQVPFRKRSFHLGVGELENELVVYETAVFGVGVGPVDPD